MVITFKVIDAYNSMMNNLDIKQIRYKNAVILRDLAGGVSDFAKKVDRSQPQMSNLVGDSPIKPIGHKLARYFETVFNKPNGWLDLPHHEIWEIQKEPNLIKDERREFTVENVILVSEEVLQKRHDVPLLTWVSAGAWLQNHGSFSAKDAERWLPCPVPHSIMTFVLEVEGDSMTSPYPNEKSYPHGTLIYVDPEKPIVNRCRVVAYLEKNEAYTFKRYVEDSGKKYLKPINPSYETIEITDDIRICGVVIGSFSDD